VIGNPVLRHLGFAATDRVVVIHADDLGMCQATLPAFVDLLAAGLVSSGSVMVPCPWFPQAAALLRACPTADLGLHVTLTSEWATYRWGPLTTRDPATGLLDEDGYFPRDTETLWQNVDITAAYTEMQAQVARARQAALEFTHLDSHMFAHFEPRLLPPYVALGFAEAIPALVVRHWPYREQDVPQIARWIRQWEDQGMPIFDHVIGSPPATAQEDRVRQAKRLLDGLSPGLTCFLVHAACDTPELRAITPDWPFRVADHAAFQGEELSNHIRQTGIQVIGYRVLRDAMRARL
jgi:chitin disaccharide deacetylase